MWELTHSFEDSKDVFLVGFLFLKFDLEIKLFLKNLYKIIKQLFLIFIFFIKPLFCYDNGQEFFFEIHFKIYRKFSKTCFKI
ncbi:hypothetical protein LEP1GSC132_1471 [Leptospira kirschneri str. 200803703]|nr:hypothetical protein LEP1GSC044_0159 [Leptospira kirschneri serovar Grippotyphosa str. RM52]EKP06710.1 hypothetical protein LEP1GSC018_0005 [Leptospira kirschneri str. 2008720114]EMK03464.1 hypothetical protein LEP1GSC176_1553 [Leptospira kirschneri str. MMD1493]EMN26303.1 hypothetical protein LEP1GSC065_0795 [Leptospira kirschneri serovar Sokoine str. RM1]EMO66601.1 hypothetical protein LEP1GSC132_1471 [Leptospira kirschneri str. 200803703]